jgi:hypothetical protein
LTSTEVGNHQRESPLACALCRRDDAPAVLPEHPVDLVLQLLGSAQRVELSAEDIEPLP